MIREYVSTFLYGDNKRIEVNVRAAPFTILLKGMGVSISSPIS